MIAYIEGTILLHDAQSAVVLNNGVGYLVLLSKKELLSIALGQKYSFHIHTHVREDAFELFGFSKLCQKQIFQLLISVSGVGPKLALSILSSLSSNEIIDSIVNKDIATLSSVSGIGKKTAERLSLELKDKALKMDLAFDDGKDTSTLLSLAQAIRGLGYSKAQSDKALAQLNEKDLESLPLEDLIRMTIASLTRN
jgi:holliday junction DNA helicase RuvA